jgi:hypothetical protein
VLPGRPAGRRAMSDGPGDVVRHGPRVAPIHDLDNTYDNCHAIDTISIVQRLVMMGPMSKE